MTPVELLLKLQEHEIKVSVEDGELRLSTPLESLEPELRDAVRAHEAELLGFVQRAQKGKKEAAPAITPVSRDRDLPLSFAQQRFWFLSQVEEDSSAYNMVQTYRLRGALDVPALEGAFGEIIGRHETLRTTIDSIQGQPVQVIGEHPGLTTTGLEGSGFELPVIDVSDSADVGTDSARAVDAEARHIFDLATGPLFRFALVRLAADDHVLVLNMHHTIGDRVSFGVLHDELARLYRERTGGPPAELAPLAVQYADYAHWQRDWYEREGGRFLDYWKQKLAGAPTLELPTDRPRPPAQTFRGTIRELVIPQPTADALHALSRKENCTIFMTVLAAFKLLLARYSGQEDIVVGTPSGNRDRKEVESIIGLFLNTLVLRTDLSGDPGFRELLGRVRDTCLGGMQHQQMPFEQLVIELKPERDLSRNPLFQVMFNLLGDAQLPKIGDIEAEVIMPEQVTSLLDLSLWLVSSGDRLFGHFEYNVDLFDDATIERMQRHFLSLLEEIARDPDRRIWDLPILSDAERTELLVDHNRTDADYPADRCHYQLFEARAAETPEAVAVVCDGASLAYGELNARANQIAHHLRGVGARPGVLVGISVERSNDMLAALLGIAKSGAAYVPLDPSYPDDRIAFILEDAGASLLVTSESLRTELPDRLPPLVRLDADAEAIAAQSTDNPEPLAGPDDLAYVIFTSGSTGKPKGVQIEHRALTNFLCSMAVTPGLSADDVLVAVTTISFDIAGLELYLPLLVGARVVIAAGGVESDGRQLIELLDSSGATVMQATPATWSLLVESGWQGRPDLVALCGGEAMPRELAAQLLERCSALWNMYGPTETTIWSLVNRVHAGEGQVPIGAPIANTEIYLLDSHHQPVPIGVPGELYLGGDGLARGYWNRPELTAEKFIGHPFREGSRLYNTGDLARYRPDGTIEFLGRVDHQVKVRGFRIELGEIEHVLLQHEAIKEGAVVARTRSSGDVQLVAHVVFHPGASATVSELRSHLRDKLPDYMVPPAFVMPDELPLTPNGKVDRKALARTGGGATQGAESHVPPRTPFEKFVAAVWQDVLGVERVGVQDNFFELGGHSLLAMKVVFQVEKEIGERVLPMELLMQNLGQFAEMCERRRATDTSATADPEPPRGVLGRLKQRLSRSGKPR